MKKVKDFIKRNSLCYRLLSIVMRLFRGLRHLVRPNVKVVNHGLRVSIKKDCLGIGNTICVMGGGIVNNAKVRIRGNNNALVIGENVHIGPRCSFWMEGNNISIVIGAGTTFTHTVHFCAQEDGTHIEVGDDCMFSNNIIVRTSDSHPIYDYGTQKRLNPAVSVRIGRHVWVAPGSVVMKGADIGDGVVVGSHTMVNKKIPANVLVVGMPQRIVKENIYWTREALF